MLPLILEEASRGMVESLDPEPEPPLGSQLVPLVVVSTPPLSVDPEGDSVEFRKSLTTGTLDWARGGGGT